MAECILLLRGSPIEPLKVRVYHGLKLRGFALARHLIPEFTKETGIPTDAWVLLDYDTVFMVNIPDLAEAKRFLQFCQSRGLEAEISEGRVWDRHLIVAVKPAPDK